MSGSTRRIVNHLTLLAAVAMAAALPQSGAAEGVAAQTLSHCGTEGKAQLFCGLRTPEDLIAVPGTDWVISSAYRGSGLHLVNARDKSTTVLYPSSTSREQFDTKTYGACPGPLNPAEKTKFGTIGVGLLADKSGVYTVYTIHRGNRESIEAFSVDVRGTIPIATWLGCVIAPDGVDLNSVVPIPGGGFIASNFLPPGKDPQAARARVMAGEINGELWEWHTASGWAKVPGSEAAGANGVELSKDGKWIYFNAWGSQAFVRLSRGVHPVQRADIPVGFRFDNIHWAPDGMLLGAGQTEPAKATRVVKVNPATLRVTQLLEIPDSPMFQHGSAAIQVGDEIWVGCSRADSIAVFSASK